MDLAACLSGESRCHFRLARSVPDLFADTWCPCTIFPCLPERAGPLAPSPVSFRPTDYYDRSHSSREWQKRYAAAVQRRDKTVEVCGDFRSTTSGSTYRGRVVR